MIRLLRHIRQWLDSHYATSVALAIFMLALWQLAVALFGVDLCDSGYYLTFFDNIFSAPQAVEYNFMYYLSGVAGGALQALLPEQGRWLFMRMAGVMCNVGAMAALACALRRVVPATAVILGMLMVVASLVQFPYTFNNDLMSALLWVASLALAFKGLTGGRWWHLLLAGVIVGLNIFTRIPNVLAIGLAAMPFVAHYYNMRTWGDSWRQCGAMLAGMVAGAFAVIALMTALGHWDVFVMNMSDLIGVATGRSGAASHNAGGLIREMLGFYGQCLLVGLKALVLWLAYWLIRRYVPNAIIRSALYLAITALLVYFMSHQSHIMHPLWVMCVVGLAWVIGKGGFCAVAAWLGLYMLLVFPLGSDGATNNGAIIAWMAAPLAALLWQRRHNVVFLLAFIAVGLFQTLTVGAYFDGGPLWHKTAAISDNRASGILTTPQRAQIINETLSGLKPFLHEGDTLLCYGSIPMMNHLTRTVPAIGCSWPELLSAQALNARFGAAGHNRPAVLRQKFNNLGPYWSDPTDDYLTSYTMTDDKFLQQDKMDILNRWMAQGQYRIVWQNRWFTLYVSNK